MNEWDRKYVEERKKQVEELINEKLNLYEKISNETEKSKRYSIFWRLKEVSEDLGKKYMLIQRVSHIDYTNEINNAMCSEIYYFEKCFSMLKEKHGAERIDLQHYLNAANLEYKYFIDLGFKLPEIFLKENFELKGITEVGKYNLIINNIKNAQKNLKLILDYKEKEQNHKEFFLYLEVMGDLYVHIYLLLQRFGYHSLETLKPMLFKAYYYYHLSYESKLIIQKTNPQTYFDGLYGWPCFGIFIDFYHKEIGDGNAHNVRLKKELFEKKLLTDLDIKEILDNIRGD